MKIDCEFRGCSCGCTPYEYRSFEGEEPDIYIAIANWVWDNGLTTSGEPFRKLNIPEESKEILRKVIKLNMCIRDKENKISFCKTSIKGLDQAAATLEIPVPDAKAKEIEKFQKAIADLNEQILPLKSEKEALLNFDATKVKEGNADEN